MAGAAGIIVINVVSRYVFDEGRIELEELQWHLYSVGFLFGMSYAYQADTHIRVDLLHERMPPRLQAWIELYGIGCSCYRLLPDSDLQRALRDLILRTQRGFSVPGGLPLRWLIKAALPVSFTLLLLSVFSRLLRMALFVLG